MKSFYLIFGICLLLGSCSLAAPQNPPEIQDLLAKSLRNLDVGGKISTFQSNFELKQGVNKDTETIVGSLKVKDENKINIECTSDNWAAIVTDNDIIIKDRIKNRKNKIFAFEPIETSFGEMKVKRFISYPFKSERLNRKEYDKKLIAYKNDDKNFDSDKYAEMVGPEYFAEKVEKLAHQPFAFKELKEYLSLTKSKLIKAGDPQKGTPYIVTGYDYDPSDSEDASLSTTIRKLFFDPTTFLPIKIVISSTDNKDSETISLNYQNINNCQVISRFVDEEYLSYSHAKKLKQITFSGIEVNAPISDEIFKYE